MSGPRYRWTPDEYVQRPADQDPRLCEQICDRIANGELLAEICAGRDMPFPATFMRWTQSDPQLLDNYREALRLQTDVHADEIILVSRDPDPQSARVQLDALKFRVERMQPGKYGPRATLGIINPKDGDRDGGIDWGSEVRRKLEQMAERAAAEERTTK